MLISVKGEEKTSEQRLKKIICLIMAMIIFMATPIEAYSSMSNTLGEVGAKEAQPILTPKDYGPFKNVTHTVTLDEGHEQLCKRNMTGEIKFDWPDSGSYVDIVIIQDLSGSFKPTISVVGDAMKELADSLNMGTDVDGISPKDRIMVASYQGAEKEAYVAGPIFSHPQYSRYKGSYFIKQFYSVNTVYYLNTVNHPYKLDSTELFTNREAFKNKVTQLYTPEMCWGGTPTVDGMVHARRSYQARTNVETYNNPTYKVNGLDRTRKTIYMLITDGVANTVKWENVPADAKNMFKLNTTGDVYYADKYKSTFNTTPGATYTSFGTTYKYTDSSKDISYIWYDRRALDNDGAIMENGVYTPFAHMYKPMLKAMEYYAERFRENAGINYSPAEFISGFWSYGLNATHEGYGPNYDTKMKPIILSTLLKMTGNKPNYFATSDTSIHDFTSQLLSAFQVSIIEKNEQIEIMNKKILLQMNISFIRSKLMAAMYK